MAQRALSLSIRTVVLFLFVANAVAAPYVESSLRLRTGTASVIVTAKTSKDAAIAVREAGGRVIHDLWIIDAVSAQVAAECLMQLAADPRVLSIVENKKTRAAEMPGWVSDKRIVRSTYPMPANVDSPGVMLADGGFAVVSHDGTFLIGNDDGSERVRVVLPVGNYGQTPLLTNGNILVSGGSASAAVTLLRPNGSVIWQNVSFTSAAPKGNAVSGSNGLIYVVDNNRQISALGAADGLVKFQKTFGTTGNVVATPAIDSNSNLYVGTTAGDVWKLDPNGAVLWTANVGAYSLSQPPQISADGGVYLISPGKPYLWVLAASSGAVRFSFTAPSPLTMNPLLTSSASYIGAKGGAYSLTLDGRTRWGVAAATLSGGLTGVAYDTTPALSPDGSNLYLSPTGSNLHVVAISASTGAVAWRQMLGTKQLCPINGTDARTSSIRPQN